MSTRILRGDCRDVLRTLPSESVHCVVTSPPYWGLRDYGVVGQIGLEADFEDWLADLVRVFAEIRRVLRDDGTLWINIGDSYATGGRGGNPTEATSGLQGGQSSQRASIVKRSVSLPGSLKPKDLIGQPWRLAFALRDAGWFLRQDIIWHKPNPMPESIVDRCTKAHEYIFLLSKCERYAFDADAMQEPVNGGAHARRAGPNSRANVDRVPRPRKVKVPGGWDIGEGAHGTINRAGRTSATYREPGVSPKSAEPGSGIKANSSFHAAGGNLVDTRNKRSVWTVATEAFTEAHFATFPAALIEPCIKAGCPEGGTVLDPFGGAGTTGLVADRLGRNAILIELNPEYADMAERRISGDAPLFASVGAA